MTSASPFERLKGLITDGHERSVRAKKNIIASVFIKGFNILVGFLLVPMTIGYVNPSVYGIWLTLTSIVAWTRFFDVGLGHGLKNKFAEALARGDRQLARVYVSTTFWVLSGIVAGLLLVFLVANAFLNWASILNADSALAEELSLTAALVFSFFCLNFVASLINAIVNADQRNALEGFFQFLTHAGSLLAIFLLTQLIGKGSIVHLALAISGVPLLIMIGVNVYLFARDYRDFLPSLRLVDRRYFRDLISLGSQFFVVQIIGIVIFQTDNMIITHLYGPAEVTPYGTAFKYFGLITQGFSIVSAPFWSAFTEAYHRHDVAWIEKTMKRLIQVWALAALGALLLLAISGPFYRLWVPSVEVPFALSVFFCLYVILLTWGTPFVTFVNGVSKIRLQLLVSSIGGLLNIPLSVFLARDLGMGTPGVIFATVLCLSFGYIFAPIQYRKIIRGKARGIWNQ